MVLQLIIYVAVAVVAFDCDFDCDFDFDCMDGLLMVFSSGSS